MTIEGLGWGRALGYHCEINSVKVVVRRYENGGRPIPPWIARLAWMYGRHGIPGQFLSERAARDRG
jgi:hypothetical protein